MKCAVVSVITNEVLNVIIADISDLPPDNCFLVDATDKFVGPGWFWDGNNFYNPNPEPVE